MKLRLRRLVELKYLQEADLVLQQSEMQLTLRFLHEI